MPRHRRTESSASTEFRLNPKGDVYASVVDGVTEPINPDDWGWTGKRGKNKPDKQLSLEDIRVQPEFSVEVREGPRFLPGPRPKRYGKWLKWDEGAAPPSCIRSRAEEGGTRAYANRLSDSLGQVAKVLPARPERSPFHVYDFVTGRMIVIGYAAPSPKPGSTGTVYVLDDGHGIKIGHTMGQVYARVRSLQTGNPRRIRPVAEIHGASVKVESNIQDRLSQWNTTGEWYAREPILEQVREAGGWEQWLLGMIPKAGWAIVVYQTD